MHRGELFGVGLAVAHEHDHGHGRLDGEDVLFRVGAPVVAAEVDHPQLIGQLSGELPQAPEGVAGEPARPGDERDDPRALAVGLKGLPQRPAPEVDVEVVSVLKMNAVAVLLGDQPQITKQAAALLAPGHRPGEHPAAGASALDVALHPAIGRVADHHGHLTLGLDSFGAVLFLGQHAPVAEEEHLCLGADRVL